MIEITCAIVSLSLNATLLFGNNTANRRTDAGKTLMQPFISMVFYFPGSDNAGQEKAIVAAAAERAAIRK